MPCVWSGAACRLANAAAPLRHSRRFKSRQRGFCDGHTDGGGRPRHGGSRCTCHCSVRSLPTLSLSTKCLLHLLCVGFRCASAPLPATEPRMPFPQLAHLIVELLAMSSSELYPQDLQLKQVVIVHRHGARTPVHKDVSGMLFPGVWKQCALSPFLHAIQTVGGLKTDPKAVSAVKSSASRGVPDHGAHQRPPTFARIAFGAASGSPVARDHIAASRTVQQLRSLGVSSTAIADSDCFYGQLTDTGKHMMFELGGRLRELYVDELGFLPKILDTRTSRSIYLRSTDYSRTIESLQYFVHGLYPPMTRQAPKTLGLQIHVRPDTAETMMPKDDCAALAVETRRFRDTFKSLNKDRLRAALDQFPKLVRAFDGESKMSDLNKVFRLYDTLKCVDAHDLPLPPGVTKAHIQQLEDLVVDQWARIYTSKDTVKQMSIGRFVSEMAAPIASAAKGDRSASKLAVFSGHDSTLVPVLAAFNAFDGRFPGFASYISVELFQDRLRQPLWRRMLGASMWSQPQQYVRMSFNGVPRVIPACAPKGSHRPGEPALCTLDAFMKEVERITPKDYPGMCNASKERAVPDWD
ncbi:histidine phosphatase superfamily [Entophlyctis helioformis]|nr:histidine phosphatase superfamily [Entophlyctis helioformis]